MNSRLGAVPRISLKFKSKINPLVGNLFIDTQVLGQLPWMTCIL